MIDLIPARMIEQLKFQVYEPCAQLKPWLQCLWSIDTGGSLTFSSSKFYPDGGSTLTVKLSNTGPSISVILNKRTFEQAINNHEPVIGVRFNPSGLYTLLGLNLFPYANSTLRLGEDLSPPWYSSLNRVVESMPLSSLPRSVHLLESWLLNFVTHLTDHRSALTLAKTVQASNLPIRDLVSSLGLSKRTLERRLVNEAGFTPKELVNVRRLQQARQLLCHSDSRMTDIATQCGYFDQAHFTHAFKQLTLETPSEYRRRKSMQNCNL